MDTLKRFAKKLGKKGWLIGIIVLAIASFSFYSSSYFEISKNLEIFISVYKQINSQYVDDVDPSILMREGIDAMLEELDPYTVFYSESEIEDYRTYTTGRYGGVGATIRKSGDYIIVTEPYEGFPAHTVGMMAGDKIIEIDNVSTKGKSSSEVSKMLKGTPGTSIEVKVLREPTEEEHTFSITREEIKLNNVPSYAMVNDDVGYIKLTQFTPNAGKNVGDALKELKEKNPGIKGVVLDLRGNGGGLLDEAIKVSNVFIGEGQEIVTTKSRLNEEKRYTSSPAIDEEIPLAVLINGSSASASEIVSGSIQDLDRGVVIGQTSFGKGLVQKTVPIAYNSQLKVTISKYYIPSGRCIQAYDYSNKDASGHAQKLPDSLRTAFKTKGGRTVFDGNGIHPDIEVKPQELNLVTLSLWSKNLIFNYATAYRAKHENIPTAREFKLTEADFDEFKNFISGKDYGYSTQSEKAIEELEEQVKEENYHSAVHKELENIKAKIQEDKKKDIDRYKNEIIELLEEEIVSRYYHQQGRYIARFDDDAELLKAIEFIEDAAKYKGVLTVDNN